MSRVLQHPGCPETVARLDLTRHGLLEASAGTGKTYAIEHLVLRMLLENDQLELPQILVLTFTEKAAGELKEKIRGRLAWRLAQGGLTPSARDRLRDAHLGFDRASIHTIHGFCQRVLRNYAFENNALFRLDLVKDNREVLQQALVEEMRSTWLTDAGEGPEGLAAFRAMAGALGLGARARWDGKLLQVAESYNPARGDALLPECDPARVAAAEDAMLAAVEALRILFPGLGSGNSGDTSFGSDVAKTFLTEYRTIRFTNATLKKKTPQVVESALALAAACPPARGRAERLEQCEAFLEAITLTAAKQNFACLLPGPGEGDALSGPALEALQALVRALDNLRGGSRARARERAALAYADQRKVILGLRNRAQAFKREKGLIGFDDMIEGVHAALKDRPGLDRALRLEYRCCLVDEFQDTDPLQWDIFRRLFLEAGGTHPLFLIGDPKQAIYRFRGGDIFTYMDARGALQDLSQKGKAQGLSLDTNYRSSEAMVEACNAIFAH
ncbi:MAG TPA: UvrD-helicase domain-containing protein, partial [Fibrobacteria bacterium]|nr:UvrD-helicase domain-containing protein [Fibrobacteria bacterium]